MLTRGVLVLLKFYWAPDIVEFVLGRFSHFNIAIAYSNSTFCGAWTPSFCEFTQNFSKTSTPLRCVPFPQFVKNFSERQILHCNCLFKLYILWHLNSRFLWVHLKTVKFSAKRTHPCLYQYAQKSPKHAYPSCICKQHSPGGQVMLTFLLPHHPGCWSLIWRKIYKWLLLDNVFRYIET